MGQRRHRDQRGPGDRVTDIVVQCPRCGEKVIITLFVIARLVYIADGSGWIEIESSTPNTPHTCKES